jgi:hypothetical protein
MLSRLLSLDLENQVGDRHRQEILALASSESRGNGQNFKRKEMTNSIFLAGNNI